MITQPFQHQFIVFGGPATLTRHASGIVELYLSPWAGTSETTVQDAREIFGLCPLAHCHHLVLSDVLPVSEV